MISGAWPKSWTLCVPSVFYFVVINIYWYCYQQIEAWGINVGVIDRILLNFDRTAGLFHNILWTKLFFAVVFLCPFLSGNKGVKEEKITWENYHFTLRRLYPLFSLTGGCSICPCLWMPTLAFYILTMSAGYICLLMGGGMDVAPVEE